jgi:hypothetical protein
MNPMACKIALEKIVENAGLKINIGVVYGDDITQDFEKLRDENKLEKFNLEEEYEEIPKKKLMSANYYIGAFPIVKALEEGAQIVITGRCVDSALVLAPLIHEFKWKNTDFDLLAAGSLCGHIIECGCQCTGGNFTDWELTIPWDNVGFPIVECFEDGSFIVTKPENTGGLVR